jgi:hypothetical protein
MTCSLSWILHLMHGCGVCTESDALLMPFRLHTVCTACGVLCKHAALLPDH